MLQLERASRETRLNCYKSTFPLDVLQVTLMTLENLDILYFYQVDLLKKWKKVEIWDKEENQPWIGSQLM